VRKIYTVLAIFLLVAVLVGMSGCAMPSLIFKTNIEPTRTTANPIPYTVTVTVPAISPTASATTPAPAASVAPSPTPATIKPSSGVINPSYTAPAISSGNTAVNLPNLADIIARVRPSVVAINTSTTARSIFGGTFNQEGAGSGWIIDSNGLIVTNNHVVEGADKITVTLEDGRNYEVKKTSTDATSDLAVLKIDATGLPAVKIGDSSQIRVGDWVIAIGNSLGEGISATKGIISARGVSVSADNGETLYDLLQTDAAINPGNSGGPLINLAGEVIGINSIKVAQVGVEGMGYAISTQTSLPIITALITNGYVARPWLGVKLYEVDEYAVDQLNLKVDKGVLITLVVANGPAYKAGIKKYDVITNFDGQNVNTIQELVKLINNHKINDTVKVTYWRDDQEKTISLTLEQAPTSP
jgi:serine protease Do